MKHDFYAWKSVDQDERVRRVECIPKISFIYASFIYRSEEITKMLLQQLLGINNIYAINCQILTFFNKLCLNKISHKNKRYV